MPKIFDSKDQSYQEISQEYFKYLCEGGTVIRAYNGAASLWYLSEDNILTVSHKLPSEEYSGVRSEPGDHLFLSKEASEALTTEIDSNEFYKKEGIDTDA